MNWHKLAIFLLAAIFFTMLVGSIGSHVILGQAPLKGIGSASFLFVAGALVFLTTAKTDRIRLLTIGVLGLIAEIVGVNSGWIFGRYEYTNVLAPNIWGTPLVMICAWFILIGYAKQLLLRFNLSLGIEAILIGIWMTAIDLVLDPIAAHPFNFWNWIDVGAYYGIPLQNFIGWFVVSGLISTNDNLLFKFRWQKNGWSRRVGICIVFLYTICAFGYGYWFVGSIGITLCLVHSLLVMELTKTTAFHSTMGGEISQ